MKRYLLLLALVCLLGNRVLAQNSTAIHKVKVTEVIDFTGWALGGQYGASLNGQVSWSQNTIRSITGTGTEDNTLTRSYTNLKHGFYVSENAGGSPVSTYTPQNGTYDFDPDFSGKRIDVPASYFNDAAVGYAVRVNITNKRDNAEIVFKEWESYPNDFFRNDLDNDFALVETDDYFQFTINNSNVVSKLQNTKGLGFQGHGFSVTSVQLLSSTTPGNIWKLWGSETLQQTYLQKQSQDDDYFNITNLKEGDVVTIWGDNGDSNNTGGFRVRSNNNDKYNQSLSFNGTESQQITMSDNGTLQLQFFNSYSGVAKITIEFEEVVEETVTPRFDYDPGYEEYDMYDEFSQNDPKKYETQNNQVVNVNKYSTSYTLSPEETGFKLNGNTAKYIILHGSKITANNRIAIDPEAGTWRFNFGLRAPDPNVDPTNHDNEKWANFSVCNLKEGDRVVISYSGTAPVFSSVAGTATAPTGPYNGCNAFFDLRNNGTYDNGEDVYITSGAQALSYWQRGEGNFYIQDHGERVPNNDPELTPQLLYIRYTIMEDGHLDLAIAPDTRIVKIKIYSDHQASMVDEYDADKYTARFDITGELQAKEHIMPGGLEVHVGSDDASQHAHVVYSPNGPVSIVNAVDGFKLPGMSRNENGNLQFQFDLANNIPETGTFYKFMPLEKGTLSLTFQAVSMNYYRYDLNGDAVYYGDVSSYHDNNWAEYNDRPNEQTVNTDCPYYLVKVKKEPNGNTTTSKVKFKYTLTDENGETTSGTINPNDQDESKRVLWAHNGDEITITPVDKVNDNETYYLYGGWNATGLYYNGSLYSNDSGKDENENPLNNLEYFPFGDNGGNGSHACGVAKLREVVFNPDKKIYPLAKWVPNGTTAVKTGNGVPNPDTFETEYVLADLYGYNDKTKITVKKMSGNITACHPYLVFDDPDDDHHSKLMIDGITFDETNGGKDKGGTILIKIGEPNKKSDPVYTLTIAYSTNPIYDGNSGTGTRGHIWDYSSNSLHGLEWKAPHQPYGAQTKDYGHYFANYFAADLSNYSSADEVFKGLTPSGSGLLSEELSGNNSDWSFNYNLVNAGNLYDPLFMNKYDTEGDNADLIWETEGTVIKASANSSVMFNEFTGSDIHQSTVDPDRYVGILKGSEFRIPWLMPNDRVIIWMGAGKGAFNDHVVFNIRGAYDAVHNVIAPTDDYIVGGSHWNVVKNEEGQVVTNDPYYRGCYHFFAQGHDGGPADMVFNMVGGNLCKIYKIQIYRGDRIITNEVVGETSNDKFLLWSRAKDPNDANDVAAIGDTYNWTLKYFGKDQKLADGTNSVNNDIVAWTGAGIGTKTLTTSDETDPTAATYNTFTFQHDYNTIGTFRARGKDMEKNMKYVADYGEHNVTVAHQQTMKYPYTWDLMDMTGWSNNATRFINEDAYGSSSSPTYTRPEWFDNDPQWNASYEKSSTDLSLFGKAVGNDQGYVLRLNSQETPSAYPQDNIFESAQTIDNEPYYGNQFWRDGEIVPESQGLWFHTLDQSSQYGSLRVYDDGMSVAGSHSWRYNMVVPNVPKDAAVYMRIKKARKLDCEASYKFAGSDASELTLLPTENDDEYIVAIKNDKGAKKHLTLSLAGYQMKKLSVSTDPKKLNIRGWATESRDHVIDPELTAYLTGKDIETCVVTGVDYANKTITLTRVYSRPNNTAGEETTTPAYVMRKLADGGKGASILHNKAVTSLTATDGEIKILDGGFHLFVPDMHDYDKANDANGDKTITDNNSMLVARVTKTTSTDKIPGSSGNYTNYALTYKHFKLDADGNQVSGSSIVEGTEAFYRIAATGASSSGNQGYLPLETKYVDPSNASYGTNPSTNNNGGNAKFSIIFEDEFENINPGITTTIDDIESSGRVVTSEGFYNLNGQKINGIPTQKGMYIVNGKKVLVK